MLLTGLAGFILTIGSAPLLSHLTFNNNHYTWAFVLLSVTLLANQLSAGQAALLQGLRKVSHLAKTSLLGNVLGLVLTIPLYYLYGINGIVPAIIISACITLLLNWYFASKLNIKKTNITLSETFSEGKTMLKMGFLISLNGLIVLFIAYIVRIFINQYGNLEDVGLYNAGFAIINSYVGMVFVAMGTDYYPRLSAVANDIVKTNQTINQQAEIALLLIVPIVIVFIFSVNWLIQILYSNAFLPIQQMLLYAALGMVFKALSWSIAFIFLAKGKSKAFFYNEIIANLYILAFNLAGYYYYGLTGLGYAFLITFVLYCVQVCLVASKLFHYKLSRNLVLVLFINIILTLIALSIALKFSGLPFYLLGLVLFILSGIYSFYGLNQRLALVQLIKSKFGKD
jgi:O-antigen/teichoic acid export membrane protein